MDEEAQITVPELLSKLEKLMAEMSQLIMIMKAMHNNPTMPGNNWDTTTNNQQEQHLS